MPLTSQLLTWRDARRGDGVKLERFTCARPKPKNWRLRHPRMWELTVQSGIRTQRPPLGPDYTMLLGEDDEDGEIGAVSCSLRLDIGEYKICGLAVSVRYRGGTGGHARECLDVCLGVLEADAAALGAVDLYVRTEIDRRNEPSQRLARSAGFAPTSLRVGPDLVVWDLARDLG